MKKLFTLITLGLILVSCSSNIDNVSETNSLIVNPIQTKVNVYSHGYNLTTTSRSADVNGNMWTYMPEYPTQTEVEQVMKYIASKPQEVVWPEYTNFYIQHVGGAHHTYYYNDNNNAPHSMDGTQSMELLTVVEKDGTVVHVNNFNGGKCDNQATHNSVLMNNGLKGIYATNEYSSSTIKAYKVYYFDGNYYIGLDYNMKKNDGEIKQDEIYDDWILKIIPTPNETPKQPSETNPTEEYENLEGMVETNLSINTPHDNGDYIETKLSVHVRDTTDFKIIMPIPDEYYCQKDDMFIVMNHDNYSYNNTTVTMNINNSVVTLTIQYSKNNITISSSGINADILKFLRTTYGDGLTFEIWNYYNDNITRTKLHELLDKSIIITNTKNYINTIVDKNIDCIITEEKKDGNK